MPEYEHPKDTGTDFGSWVERGGHHTHPHRFGSNECSLRNREIGRFHGDHVLDVLLPARIRDAAMAAGWGQPHPILPESGWVSTHIHQLAKVERAISPLQQSLELALEQYAARQA